MLKFIEQNPFRVLGVYANTSLKELTANKTRISAYAKVGKTTSFPLDNIGEMATIIRTADTISAADHELTLTQNKLTHALFWFVNGNSNDESAIRHYINGEKEEAKHILSQEATHSSLVNLSVIGIIENDYTAALQSMSRLVGTPDLCEAYVRLICGDTFTITPSDLWQLYIDVLLQEIDPQLLLSYAKDIATAEKELIQNKVVDTIIGVLKNEIDKAQKASNGTSPQASLQAGMQLMEVSKRPLDSLRGILATTDLRYVNIADSLANQILQCGINYYNESEEEDCEEKALVLQEYAGTVAVGSLAVGRCKRNLEILLRKKEERVVAADMIFIRNKLEECQKIFKTVPKAAALVAECKPHLEAIAANVGKNELYIRISSLVASHALAILVAAVNRLSNDRDVAKEALEVMNSIQTLDVDQETANRIATNYSILLNNMKNMPTAFAKTLKSMSDWFFFFVVILSILCLTICS